MGWWSRLGWWRWPIVGLLLGSGFMLPSLWPLGLVGGAAFFELSLKEQQWRRGLLGAWVAFTVKAALAIFWLWSTYPIEWLPEDLGRIQMLLIGQYWLLSAVAIGVSGLVAYAFTRAVRHFTHHQPIATALIVPFGWVVAEIAGSVAYSLVMIGPGGTVNASLSFAYVGYQLAIIPGVIGLSMVAGVYGLSYVFGLLSYVGWWCTGCRSRWGWLVPIGMLLGAALVGAGLLHLVDAAEKEPPTTDVTIAIVDTNFPPRQLREWAGVERLTAEMAQAVNAALIDQPEYLLLPEDARFFDQTRPAVIARDGFAASHRSPTTTIIDTGRITQGSKTILQSFVYNGPSEPVDQVQKRYLVPQGEFISYYLLGLLKLFGFGPLVEQVLEDMSYQVGPATDQSDLSVQTPGILFCFESVDPRGVRRVLQEHPKAPFIAHPMSHALFHRPAQLWQQLDTMLQVQAVWNRVYIVSAGNHVSGKVYTPKGAVLTPDELAQDQYWNVRFAVVPSARQ